MTRPLTSDEKSRNNRKSWYRGEEKKARETRGEVGAMEFWLRITRSRIVKETRAGRSDVVPGFGLVVRLFLAAMEKRAAGDGRLWADLMHNAQAVLEQHKHD